MATLRTSSLLDRGLVSCSLGLGLPAYSPLGIDLLKRIELALVNAAVQQGFGRFGLPNVMRNDDLFMGEPVGNQFLSKIVFLHGPFEGYHLLTTPEMMFVRMSASSTLSHRSFPIRCAYTTNIFRQMKEVKSLLTCRQFRVFGCISLHKNIFNASAELRTIIDLCTRVLSSFGISAHEVRQDVPLHSELLYVTDEGDAKLEVGGTWRKALSLAIGYQYGAGMAIPIDYRTESNDIEHPLMVSFALCTNRLLFSVFDAHRDALGFALPSNLRPFDVVLVPRATTDLTLAEDIAHELSDAGVSVALDDRVARSVANRRTFADYIGAPATLVIHRSGLYISGRGDPLSYHNAIASNQAVAAVLRMIGR